MSRVKYSFLIPGLVAAGLILGAGAASAEGLIGMAPSVHLAVQNVSSQAQLAETLRSQGYSDIRLSEVAATPATPHPERISSLTDHPEKVPVHSGWNGVAVKNGQVVQVYVDN